MTLTKPLFAEGQEFTYDLADVGRYTLAANLAAIVLMVSTGLQRAWTPFLDSHGIVGDKAGEFLQIIDKLEHIETHLEVLRLERGQ